MLKNSGNIKLVFGRINDDKVLGYPAEFKESNINHEESFLTYTDPDTGYTLYSYKGNLYTYKELRMEYLKNYYDVK